jgi:hypothetical protein
MSLGSFWSWYGRQGALQWTRSLKIYLFLVEMPTRRKFRRVSGWISSYSKPVASCDELYLQLFKMEIDSPR